MKMNEVLEMTGKELAVRKHELVQQIFNLRIQQQAGQLERPHLLRALRRDVARLETAITQKAARGAA